MNLINLLPKNWILHRQVAMYIAQYKKFLLSYSGGIDSTVLLDILTTLRNINNANFDLMQYPLTLRVAHVHHSLHRHADMWVDHCQQQCTIRNVPFQVIYIKNFCHMYHQPQCNIEAAARYLRYNKLYDLLNIKEVLVTAHHMNDQVETFFLALKRGSGPHGLSGMNIDTNYHQKYRILRPLLKSSRVQLEKHAVNNKLHWIEDDTNNNTAFDRNFFRVKILPVLYDRWPSFGKVVTRTAELCKNQENLLNELLLESLNQLMDVEDNSLCFVPLLKFSVIKRQALLRLWISNFSVNMPSYQFIQRIWKEVVLSKCDATPILRLDQYLCRRFRKKLYIIPISMMIPLNTIILHWINLYDAIILPYNLGLLIFQSLIYDKKFLENKLMSSAHITSISNIFFNFFNKFGKVLTSCIVRSPRCDEKISIHFGSVDGLLYIVNRHRGRKLKKIWQELGIPPWLRSRIPLLFYDHILIAAIGVFVTKQGVHNTMDNSIPCQIFWMQDAFYYKFFKNSTRDNL